MVIFTGISTAIGTVLVSIGLGKAAAVAVAATITRLAVAAGAALISRALAPKPSIPKQEIQATLNQEAGPRTRLYGRGLLGGARAFWEASGGNLHQIALLNHGAVSRRLAFWFGGVPVSVSQSGDEYAVTSGSASGNVTYGFHDGSGNGGDWDVVRTTFPDLWTTDHRLEEQATLYARFRAPSPSSFSRNFPAGANTDIQVECEGVLVKDVRNDTLRYSDNAALVIYDYLTHPDGYRIDPSRVDTASFAAFADLSDEAVPLKDGGTEPRYRLWGIHALTDPPKNVLVRMTAASDAVVYQNEEGKVAILGGAYSEPDVTITDADIISFDKIDSNRAMEGFNVLKGLYTSADHDYADTEAEAWEDAASLAEYPERVNEIQADMAPSHGQMRRLMKINMGRLNRRWTGRIVTSLVGIKARFPKGDGVHTIQVRYGEMGIDEPVEVLGHTIIADKGEGGAIIWRCAIEIGSIDPAWYDWDAANEEGTAPAVADKPEAEEVPIPSFTVSQDGGDLVATVTDIGRADLELFAEYKLTSATEYNSMPASGLRATAAVAAGTYHVRCRFTNGDWSADQSFTKS